MAVERRELPASFMTSRARRTAGSGGSQHCAPEATATRHDPTGSAWAQAQSLSPVAVARLGHTRWVPARR
jgi:hypothetical protein